MGMGEVVWGRGLRHLEFSLRTYLQSIVDEVPQSMADKVCWKKASPPRRRVRGRSLLDGKIRRRGKKVLF